MKLPILVIVTAAVMMAVVTMGTPGRTASAAPADDAQEQAFLGLLNNYRAQNGRGSVAIDVDLQEAAEWHSNDMGQNRYFSHTDSLGRSPFQRMCAFGYCYNTSKAENIAAGQVTAQQVFDAWRNSPDHNTNMLNANMKAVGIARVQVAGSPYKYYWTNTFGGVLGTGGSTPAPTAVATATPTRAPTPVPTLPPTATPTRAPTATPTRAPTPAPTIAPTATPTRVPTPTVAVTPPRTTATPRQTLAPTRTPTPTFAPPPAATNTPGPTGTFTVSRWSDIDCDGTFSSRDVQSVMRRLLQQRDLSTTGDCPELSGEVLVDGFGTHLWGDVDCDDALTSRDGQALLRKVLQQQALSQAEPCPDIGELASMHR